MKKLLKKFKSIIIVLLLVPMLSLSFNSQRADGFVMAAPVAVGGATITAGQLAVVIGCGLVAGGAMLDATANDGTACKYIAQKLIDSGNTAQYLGTKTLEGGQQVLIWTKDGIDWLSNTLTELKASPSITVPNTNLNFVDNNTFYVPHTTAKFAPPTYYNYTNVGSFPFSSTVDRSLTLTAYSSSGVVISRTSFGLYKNLTYDLLASQYYSASTVFISLIGHYQGQDINYGGTGELPFGSYVVSSMPVTYSESVCPTANMVKNYGDSVCVDNLTNNVNNTDGSISYQPSVGIPLTSTDGQVYTTPFPDIPYGKSWDTLKDKLTCIQSTDTTGSTTGDTTTGAAVQYSSDTMNYNYKPEKYKPVEETLSNYKQLGKIAEEMYDSFRSRSDDITKIAENTGWDIKDIQQIKEHIFLNKLRLDDGIRRLDPDYEMALAWERLIQGEYYENDILLLKHELYESTYYKLFDCLQREAHDAATKFFDWASYIENLR